MANEKISAMTNAGTLTGAELVPIVQGGANVKTTTQDIANLGGGGVLAGGLGISLDTITNPGTTAINNTGTIVQPGTTGAVGAGVYIKGGDVTNPGTDAGIYVFGPQLVGGNVHITDPAGYGGSGGSFDGVGIKSGVITNMGTTLVSAATIATHGGFVGFGSANAVNIKLEAGIAQYGTTNIQGNIILQAAGGDGTGANGGVITTPTEIGTLDPGVAGDWYRNPLTNGVVISQGP